MAVQSTISQLINYDTAVERDLVLARLQQYSSAEGQPAVADISDDGQSLITVTFASQDVTSMLGA